jgi:ATP-binding cassette subfamily F protein 3
LLILDEPTNHLDVDSREALEDALKAFTGTVLLVTHDRALLDAVGTRTIAIEDQTLHSYLGGWPGYLRARAEKKDEDEADSSDGSGRVAGSKGSANSKGSTDGKRSTSGMSKNRARMIKQLEADIEAAETKLAELEDELADPAIWNDSKRAAESTARHTVAKEHVKSLYERWESALE